MSANRSHLFDRLATVISVGGPAVAIGFAIYLCLPAAPWTAPAIDLEPDHDPVPRRRQKLKLSDLAVIWQRDLRQPVVDPPAEKPRQEKKQRLAIQLLGTAVETDRQYGVFRLSDNRTVVRAVGDEVDGFEIIQISRGRARLRNCQRECELRVSWFDQIVAGGKGRDDG